MTEKQREKAARALAKRENAQATEAAARVAEELAAVDLAERRQRAAERLVALRDRRAH